MGRGRPRPFDAGGAEGGMITIEIVSLQEEKDATAGLIADELFLFGRGGASEEDGGGVGRRTRRADGDPAFALLGLVSVLDQRETELADIEG